ncbi:MAG TPA: 1-deoxy-D-xylulose-5-phosphate reductoisomerase [Acidimicrobiales bacterium]
MSSTSGSADLNPGVTRVAVIGSTGSIGTQTLDVCGSARDRFVVVSLTANHSVEHLIAQGLQLDPLPEVVALGSGDPDGLRRLRDAFPSTVDVVGGRAGLVEAALVGDTVVNGVMGFAGLDVTVATVTAGKRLALANKESLIAGGPVVAAAVDAGGGEIVPVDSEHCAVHQCLAAARAAVAAGADDPVARIVLTASGGPFRGRDAADLATVTVDEALAHPTWSMGPKITVDSSTLMNKGLEVIEACELFGFGPDQVEVVVHPQSIVHSMVELVDGATLAQISLPDMRQCIGYALAQPDRLPVPFGRIDWSQDLSLTFEPPDRSTFRCLDLAVDAARIGASAPAALNAANEVAVAAFLDGLIGWTQIADVVEEVLVAHEPVHLELPQDVEDVDAAARAVATATVERLTAVQSRRRSARMAP